MAKYIDAGWLKHYVLNSDALLMPQTERAKFAKLLDAAPGVEMVEGRSRDKSDTVILPKDWVKTILGRYDWRDIKEEGKVKDL